MPLFLAAVGATDAPPRWWTSRRWMSHTVLALDRDTERAALSKVADKGVDAAAEVRARAAAAAGCVHAQRRGLRVRARGRQPAMMLPTTPQLDFLKGAGVVAQNANTSNTVVRGACRIARAGTHGLPRRERRGLAVWV
jgi:hypothetical protein